MGEVRGLRRCGFAIEEIEFEIEGFWFLVRGRGCFCGRRRARFAC